jgi:TonB family protein
MNRAPNPRLQRTAALALLRPAAAEAHSFGPARFVTAIVALAFCPLAFAGKASQRFPVPVNTAVPSLYETFDGCKGLGTPILRVTVRSDGTTTRVKILRSSGCATADDRVVTAVQCWTYRPALDNGKPVDRRITVTVSW